jgi:hypothetical protein
LACQTGYERVEKENQKPTRGDEEEEVRDEFFPRTGYFPVGSVVIDLGFLHVPPLSELTFMVKGVLCGVNHRRG